VRSGGKNAVDRAIRAALVGLWLAGAAHCAKDRAESHAAGAPPDAGASAAAATGQALPSAPESGWKLPHPLTATASVIALSNLNGEIAQREQRVPAGNAKAQRELVGFYLVRSQFAGRVADLEAAVAESATVLATSDDGAAHLLRAKTLSAVHDFKGALAELGKAAAHGAEPEEVSRERGTILLAMGKEDEASALLPAATDTAPSADLVLRGGLEARLGHGAEAERLFDLARERYRDVSAFMVAWFDFETARGLSIDGDRAKVRAYLLEAVEVMPTYAHAVVHLAGLEPADRALARLDALAATSDDPDVPAAQADALRRSGKTDEAAAATARARARYEELLGRIPLAFADHAATFFLGMGNDPPRALELARLNVDNRSTDEAIELWLTAAQAARSDTAICAAARRALGRPHAPRTLHERATQAAGHCP
jgi:tetratricopeptide (TPR) repeat protein